MVNKKDLRAFIDAVKEDRELFGKKRKILGLINFYLGEVTKEDLDEVKNV